MTKNACRPERHDGDIPYRREIRRKGESSQGRKRSFNQGGQPVLAKI